ncbi:MAG: SMC-Scp complex subunit ScpB [Collinsella aerofaciens]
MSTLSTLEANSLKGALEALLLVSSDPVSAPALAGALDIAPGECASLLAELKVEYEEANRGFQLREVAGGWRLFTHPAYHDVVEAYVLSWDTQKLSQAALETLAVIAYHQPVTREVVKGIRGVNSDGVIASLVDKGLVRELGRDPERGQAIIYGTTNAFLEKFGLRSTRDLPDLEQFAPDEQSRQFIRERLSGRSIQSTLEEQAEDLDEERELIDTDVEDTDGDELLPTGDTSEDSRRGLTKWGDARHGQSKPQPTPSLSPAPCSTFGARGAEHHSRRR